jgi:hypothetical protein
MRFRRNGNMGRVLLGEAFDDVGCQQPTTVARICGTGDDDVDARDK